MNSLKKLLPLFALVLGLGLLFTQSAFKDAEKDSSTTKQWFVYNGVSPDDEHIQANYELYDEGEPGSCTVGAMRCAIFAEPELVGTEILPDLDDVDDVATKYQPIPQ